MVDVRSKRCGHRGCTTRPSYATDDGSRTPVFCRRHAEQGMVDVRSKRCAHHGCTTRPSYATDDGSRTPVFCRGHAREGMVDVRSKRCGHRGCTTLPSYATDDGSTTPMFCCHHAREGMVNVGSRRRGNCEQQAKQPSCGADGESEVAELCGRFDAGEGMVDALSKSSHFGNSTRPSVTADDRTSTTPASCNQQTAYGAVGVAKKSCSRVECASGQSLEREDTTRGGGSLKPTSGATMSSASPTSSGRVEGGGSVRRPDVDTVASPASTERKRKPSTPSPCLARASFRQRTRGSKKPAYEVAGFAPLRVSIKGEGGEGVENGQRATSSSNLLEHHLKGNAETLAGRSRHTGPRLEEGQQVKTEPLVLSCDQGDVPRTQKH
ncbi:unnamed protein product [Scytosiphon promiscuus]